MTASEAENEAPHLDTETGTGTADEAALQRYGSNLLRRSVGFALEAMDALPPFAPADLFRPTPCEGWDLWMLLRHVDDSLAALNEAVTTGVVELQPPPEAPEASGEPRGAAGVLAASFRSGARRLLAAWADADREGRVVLVAGCPMRAGVVAGTGAVELVVHAWDLSRTFDAGIEIPVALAGRLLRLAPLLVPGEATRAGIFASPVPLSREAAPGDRLVAFLGRDPYARPRRARTQALGE